MPLLTLLTHRLKDARDEYNERIEDSKTGHRDKYGRKTQLWYEREYAREKKRRRREQKRKERGIADGKGRKTDAMMTGAMPKEDSDVTLVEEGGGGHIVQHDGGSAEGVAGSSRDSRISTGHRSHGSRASRISRASTRHGSQNGGGSGLRDVSPMPSEHSFSSIQAQVHRQREEERARARAEAGGEGQGTKDSEDEEPEKSDDGSSDGEDGAATAANQAQQPTVEEAEEPAAAAEEEGLPASGLRGGGGGMVETDDEGSYEDEYYSCGEEEYNEHEDFDDEYCNTGSQQVVQDPANPDHDGRQNKHSEQNAQNDLDVEATQPESSSVQDGFLESQPEKLGVDASEMEHDIQGNADEQHTDRPHSSKDHTSSQGISWEADCNTESHDKGKLPDRTSRPYTLANVHDTVRLVRPVEATSESGRSQNTDEQTATSVDGSGKGKVKQDDTSHAKPGARKTPKSSRKAAYEDLNSAQGRSTDAKKKKDQTYEDAYASDDCLPGAKFSRSRPQTHAPYNLSPYSTYGTHSHYQERSYSSQHATPILEHRGGGAFGSRYVIPRGYGGYKGSRTAEDDSDSDEEIHVRQGPRRRWKPEPESESSTEEGSSDEDTESSSFRQWSKSDLSVEESSSGEHIRLRYSWPRNYTAGVRVNDLRPEVGSRHTEYGKQRTSASQRQPRQQRQRTRTARNPSPSSHPRQSSSRAAGKQPARGRDPYSDAQDRRGTPRGQASSESTPSPPPRRSRRRATGKQKARDATPPPKYNTVESVKEAPPNHYALLSIGPEATQKEIEQAAKKARIQNHTDQLLKLGHGKTEEEVAKIMAKASRVGQAVEILKDPAQRAKYDTQVRIWKRKYVGVLPIEED